MQLTNLRGFTTTLALIVLCAAAVIYARRVPAPVPASAPPTEFSSARAMEHVRAMAQRPHPIGGENDPKVGSYILRTLISMGLRPDVQDAVAVGTRYPVSGQVRNVLAYITGMNPGGPAVLLMAHYDGVPAGPAAGDDASGSAVVLETMRAILAGPPMRNDVIALFTDGEEPGLLGAAAFARDHSTREKVGVVLNFEARGTNGPSLMFETGAGNLDVVRVLRGVAGVRATSLSTAVYRALPNDTDLSEMAVLDKPAMNFAFIGGVQRYHTTEDDVAHLDPSSVQHQGNNALALARAFGNGPLPRPHTSDAVFFDLPLLGLVVYPVSWALPFALVGLALVIVAMWRLRKHEPNWVRGVVLGALGTVLSVIVAAAVSYGVALVLRRLHGAMPNGGSPQWSNIYAVAIALLAFAISAAGYAMMRRWSSAGAVHLGALLAWTALSLVVALRAPDVSFVFTWPALIVAAASLTPTRARARVATAMQWAGTVIALFLLVPIVYLMVCKALGVDQIGAVVLSAFTAMGAWLLAPHVETLSGARLRTPPIVVAAASLALLILGAFTVRTNTDHPVGAALIYAVDADSSTAWLTGYGSTQSAQTWLTRALAATKALPSTTPPRWLTRGFDARRIVRAPLTADHPAIAAPTATVISDTALADARRVTLRIVPAKGTRAITMSADSGTILSAAVGGVPVDTRGYRRSVRRWNLEFNAPSDTGVVLVLTIVPNAHPMLGLLGRKVGIPALTDFRIPNRPTGIIPIQDGDMTLVYRRIPL